MVLEALAQKERQAFSKHKVPRQRAKLLQIPKLEDANLAGFSGGDEPDRSGAREASQVH